eukprot:7082960-Prymnesium_polylepis.1
MVRRWSRDGQGTVKGAGQKASAYSNVFSAPLNFSASAIALAPGSPILLSVSQSEISTPLNFRASAIAVAPWKPM